MLQPKTQHPSNSCNRRRLDLHGPWMWGTVIRNHCRERDNAIQMLPSTESKSLRAIAFDTTESKTVTSNEEGEDEPFVVQESGEMPSLNSQRRQCHTRITMTLSPRLHTLPKWRHSTEVFSSLVTGRRGKAMSLKQFSLG